MITYVSRKGKEHQQAEPQKKTKSSFKVVKRKVIKEDKYKSAIERNESLSNLISTQWLLLYTTENEARKVPSYIRGIISVDRALHNVANVRELLFLLNMSIDIIKYRFDK